MLRSGGCGALMSIAIMTAWWWWRSSPLHAMVGEPSWARPPTLSPSPNSVYEARRAALTSHNRRLAQGRVQTQVRLGSPRPISDSGGVHGKVRALLNLGQSEMTLNVCSSRPVALGFDWGSMSEKRLTQVQRWLDRHKNKPLFPCLVYLGKAAKMFCIWTVCVATFRTSPNVVHKNL